MGSGKTSIGKLLSKKSGLPLIDSDKFIEEKENCTITDLFETKGDDYFRSKERDFCLTINDYPPHIISTGGGIILSSQNRDLIKRTGKVFYLHTSPTVLAKRLKHSKKRPLLNKGNKFLIFKDLYNKRHRYYQETAHHVIHCNRRTFSDIGELILSIAFNSHP